MDEVKQFFIQNWQLLASALLFLIAFISALVTRRKKGYSFSDILLGLLAKHIPEWTREAEAEFGAGEGEKKKVSVLNTALNFVRKTLGRCLSEEETSFIVTEASNLIEDVLEAPEKKEEKKVEVKKNVRYRK